MNEDEYGVNKGNVPLYVEIIETVLSIAGAVGIMYLIVKYIFM